MLKACAFFFVFVTTTASAADLLVMFKPGVDQTAAHAVFSQLGLDLRERLDEVELYILSSPRNDGEALAALRAHPLVKSAERDTAVWADETADAGRPNDSSYNMEDWLRTIDVERAWQLSTGSSDITVAILDTGMDLNHPDLREQLWVNAKEIAGNKIDDDGNGYVDDVNGWNFVGNNNNPSDLAGHGSHVAGIVGARGDNKRGTVGVNWRVTLMPVQTCGTAKLRGQTDKDKCSVQAIIKGIMYAVKNGARILNMSWGMRSSSPGLHAIITWAYQRGVLSVCAAGNDDHDDDERPFFPASSESAGVVSVAALSSSGERLAGFSNWGQYSVDLAAPGQSVYSSGKDDNWLRSSGTSMAAPVVSGVAALMLALEPRLTVLELRNGLLNAVTQKKRLRTRVATGGMISAYLALNQLSQGFQVWPGRLTLRKGASFQFTAYQADSEKLLIPVIWSVSDPDVATIDQSGTLTAVKPGTVEITALELSGNHKATTTEIRVVPLATPRSGD